MVTGLGMIFAAGAGTYEAAQPGAPLVHDHIKNNIVFDWEMGDRAATEAQVDAVFSFRDSVGETLTGDRRFVARGVVIGGRWWRDAELRRDPA